MNVELVNIFVHQQVVDQGLLQYSELWCSVV